MRDSQLRGIALNCARLVRLRGRYRVLIVTAAVLFLTAVRPFAQSDLDQFMQQVLAARDSNWRKLQQYVLDEREQVEMRGPSNALLWGERRDYSWYVRDGFFVRSPIKVNGAGVSDGEREKYERDFLERARKREERAQANGNIAGAPVPPQDDVAPYDVDGLIKQTRQPQFISSAYFLRFTFDQGRYALVGREQLDGREVLRIEYYPEQLFKPANQRTGNDARDEAQRKRQERMSASEKAQDAELRRLMNKSSKVTLWIEPSSHQIVKYTFDDLGWNFFPAQWLAQMDGATASMSMSQPFPDVWLPKQLEMNISMMLAVGSVELRYSLQYDNYRQPDVRSRITIPGH
ncbi:MAG: hypothetical protein U0Q11_00815 [Vicinamibacterales bacterium]